MTDFLSLTHGDAPLIVSVPHAGTRIPPSLVDAYRDSVTAPNDADWFVDRLYAFATDLGATLLSTSMSRAVIDVNRDPSGASLYPGQATTGLCPTIAFDGAPLYRDGHEPDEAEIADRTARWFDPYHDALAGEIARLCARRDRIIVFDAHSIRSVVPLLFDGVLPQFNIGTNGGITCPPGLARSVEAACAASGETWITDGRFRGGWITRHYARPEAGVHAIQLELSMRGYLDEESGWPPAWEPMRAAPMQATLRQILTRCIDFAREGA